MTRTPDRGSPARNDPPAITLEAIQKLLHDQQMQTLMEVNRMIEEKLGDTSRTLTQTPQQGSPESGSRSGSTVRRDPTPLPPPVSQPRVKECTYKDFMACRPKEFKGDKDPKVVVRWITEMEQIL